MHRFVDYVASASKDGIAPAGLGDWYDYGHGQPPGPSRFTPVELTATAVQVMCTDAVVEAAKVLNRPAERAALPVAQSLHAGASDGVVLRLRGRHSTRARRPSISLSSTTCPAFSSRSRGEYRRCGGRSVHRRWAIWQRGLGGTSGRSSSGVNIRFSLIRAFAVPTSTGLNVRAPSGTLVVRLFSAAA